MPDLHVPIFTLKPEFTPSHATTGASGHDVRAHISAPYRIQAGCRATIPLGFHVAVPAGHVGLICPRSGLAKHQGVTITNAPGVIDPDFRGEVSALVINHGTAPFVVEPDERIAQFVVVPAPNLVFYPVECVEELGFTARGECGFGHTGQL